MMLSPGWKGMSLPSSLKVGIRRQGFTTICLGLEGRSAGDELEPQEALEDGEHVVDSQPRRVGQRLDGQLAVDHRQYERLLRRQWGIGNRGAPNEARLRRQLDLGSDLD